MPHHVDIHVGERLKQARALRGLSQADVGRHLKVSFQQVQKYEVGANRISASKLFDLCRFLRVPSAFFFEELEGNVEASASSETGLRIIKALAAIEDDREKERLVQLIEDVAGVTVKEHR